MPQKLKQVSDRGFIYIVLKGEFSAVQSLTFSGIEDD